LEDKGLKRLGGHTQRWRKARAEMVERVRALFAAPKGPEREIEVVCQSLAGGERSVGRGVEGVLVQAAA
jgi:hypothetical protein